MSDCCCSNDSWGEDNATGAPVDGYAAQSYDPMAEPYIPIEIVDYVDPRNTPDTLVDYIDHSTFGVESDDYLPSLGDEVTQVPYQSGPVAELVELVPEYQYQTPVEAQVPEVPAMADASWAGSAVGQAASSGPEYVEYVEHSAAPAAGSMEYFGVGGGEFSSISAPDQVMPWADEIIRNLEAQAQAQGATMRPDDEFSPETTTIAGFPHGWEPGPTRPSTDIGAIMGPGLIGSIDGSTGNMFNLPTGVTSTDYPNAGTTYYAGGYSGRTYDERGQVWS